MGIEYELYSYNRSFKILLAEAENTTETLYQPQALALKSKLMILALLRNDVSRNSVCHG